ncbi:MAG TPA: hypothetical protein VM285_03710, partial [Polyangia bacterium]|nr:hypothetical protein [Polyangia bacterium]
VVGAYQQRGLLAGSDDEPDVAHASNVGAPLLFRVSNPIVDDDSLSWRQVGRRMNRIRHFAEAAGRLWQFSDVGESMIQGAEDGVLRPGELNPRQLSENGAANRPAPLVVHESALYVQARGGLVRDIAPVEASGFNGSDLTLMSAHLLDGYTILDWCYQQTPDPVVWIVRSDGALLSLTYVRELGIIGWARHDTDGTVESVACVPEGNRDVVYWSVLRANGRYIERTTDRLATDPVCVDSSLTFASPGTTITGLDHLEGQDVSVVGDGAIIASPNNPAYTVLTVASGQITVPAAYTVAVVGLPFTTDIQTLEIDTAQGKSIRDGRFVMTRLGLFVENTGSLFAGQNAIADPSALSAGTYDLQPLPIEDTEGNAVTGVITGYREVNIEGSYNPGTGGIFLRNVDPQPLTVLAIIPQGHFPRK